MAKTVYGVLGSLGLLFCSACTVRHRNDGYHLFLLENKHVYPEGVPEIRLNELEDQERYLKELETMLGENYIVKIEV